MTYRLLAQGFTQRQIRFGVGFTLIETLVAITILTLAIVGPMTVANSTIIATGIARDQLIASHLAQEAIEYVRLIRDDDYLATRDTHAAWTTFLNEVALCTTPGSCTLDRDRIGGLHPYISPAPLYLSDDGYTQTPTDTSTPYTRTVTIKDVSLPDQPEVQVTATVSWQYHGITRMVTVTDHLTSWQ